MSIFQKDLPVSLCPTDDNQAGIKYQGLLKGIDKTYMLIEVAQSLTIAQHAKILVEFRIDANKFSFETTVFNLAGRKNVILKKPKQIHRSKIREGPRLTIPIEIHYTPWTSEQRYTAKCIDLSESGVKILGYQSLRKGDLISLNFYIRDARIRVICQGIVSWSRPDPDIPSDIHSGVQFSTISNEAKKKLANYLAEIEHSRNNNENEENPEASS